MLTKRIIPCLDVKDNRVVKGVNFLNLRDAGDPVELGKRYSDTGADELVFLDITATIRSRKTIVELVEKVAQNVFIPFTVGGGIQTVEQMDELLRCGAEKVSINTAAVDNPDLLTEAAERFGSQCVVASIDARKRDGAEGWEIFTHGGRTETGIDALDHARRLVELGAGELLITSMDRDGTRAGFDLALTRAIADAVPVPVVASGGVGSLDHLVEGVTKGHASAVLAASIFHFGEATIGQAHEALRAAGLPARGS